MLTLCDTRRGSNGVQFGRTIYSITIIGFLQIPIKCHYMRNSVISFVVSFPPITPSPQ